MKASFASHHGRFGAIVALMDDDDDYEFTAWIEDIVDKWPPLSQRQQDIIRMNFEGAI
jgi:hypothetical protein